MSLRDVIALKKEADKKFARDGNIVRCNTIGIDSVLTPAVSGRSGYVWVKEWGTNGIAFQVFTPNVITIIGLPVLVGVPADSNSTRRMVLGVDWSLYPDLTDYDGSIYMGKHASSHEWPDENPQYDAINTYAQSFVPLRTQFYSDFVVFVSPALYQKGAGVVKFEGEYVDLLPYLPDPGYAIRVLLCLDAKTNSISVARSVRVVNTEEPDYITAPVGLIGSGYVRVDGDESVLTERDIANARAFLHTPSVTFEEIVMMYNDFDMQMSIHIVNGGILP